MATATAAVPTTTTTAAAAATTTAANQKKGDLTVALNLLWEQDIFHRYPYGILEQIIPGRRYFRKQAALGIDGIVPE